jgi:hypothetical protein
MPKRHVINGLYCIVFVFACELDLVSHFSYAIISLFKTIIIGKQILFVGEGTFKKEINCGRGRHIFI